MKIKSAFLLYILLLSFSLSCDEKVEDMSAQKRTEVLASIADNVILKNYEAFAGKSDSLVVATDAFLLNTTGQNLEEMQLKWKLAATSWKVCQQFDYGPGETTVMMDIEVGTWPINTTLIENEIATTTILGDDFVANTGSTRKGLYAIEHFIFQENTTILSDFTSNTKASIRRKYLQLLALQIQKSASQVHLAWANGYKDEFVKANGLDNGSSLSMVVNKMVENLEVIINKQIGNPIGKKSFDDNGMLRPTEVEALYSDESIALTLASIEGLRAIFTADNQGFTGLGIEGYVEFLKVNTDGMPLQNKINSQLEAFRLAVAAIPPTMQTSVTDNTSAIDNAWKEGKKLLVLMKNDLTTNIGVQITFNSNDGD